MYSVRGRDYHSVFTALDNVSFDVAPGQTVGIIGPNGSGKSTFLKTMLGLLPPLKGEIDILPEPSSPFETERALSRNEIFGFVPSMPPNHVGLKVREVLALSGDPSRACRAFPILSVWMDLRLQELSDGQKQQVMVARAWLQSQHWMVLDEPSAFLDVEAQRALTDMLVQQVHRGGGVVMATHDLLGVARIAGELKASCIRQSGLWMLKNRSLERHPLDLTVKEMEKRLG